MIERFLIKEKQNIRSKYTGGFHSEIIKHDEAIVTSSSCINCILCNLHFPLYFESLMELGGGGGEEGAFT